MILDSDRGLYRHLELLARNELFESGGHLVAVGRGPVLVHDRAERVDGLTLQQDVDLDQFGLLFAGLLRSRGWRSRGCAISASRRSRR